MPLFVLFRMIDTTTLALPIPSSKTKNAKLLYLSPLYISVSTISLSPSHICIHKVKRLYLRHDHTPSDFSIMSSTGTRNSNEALLYDDGKDISNDYLPLNHRSTRTPWYRRPLPWILTAALLFVTNSMLLLYSATAWHYCKPSQFGNFEAGFTTDLGESAY